MIDVNQLSEERQDDLFSLSTEDYEEVLDVLQQMVNSGYSLQDAADFYFSDEF